MATDPNHIVLNYHNSLLRESDVHLLNGPHWLNDQIISFYLEYLERNVYEKNTELLFVSPEVVQCLKFFAREEMKLFLEPLKANEKQFIFLPWNDNDEVKAGGSHWSLLVFSRPESTFFYYDSMNHSGTSLRSLRPFLVEFAAAVNCPEFDIRQGECIQQTNSYDCGVHVLVNIELLAQRVVKWGTIDKSENDVSNDDDPMHITNQHIRQKRKEILNVIHELNGTV